VSAGSGSTRLEDAYLGARIAEGQLRRRLVRPVQRELKQGVLDALDDVGFTTACDNAVGLKCKLMEVMG
jgi:hypothetical protein